MVLAVRIDPDATVTTVDLPDATGRRLRALRGQVRGTPERAVYRERVAFHVNGDGHRLHLPPNTTAWALACAWHGRTLDRPLLGPVVLTGVVTGRGGFSEVSLAALLELQVRQAAKTVRSIMADYRQRGAPPGEAEDLVDQVLTFVRLEVAG